MKLLPELGTDGDSLDQEAWPVVASARAQSMVDGGQYVEGWLHVRQNAQGTVLAYSSIKDVDRITPTGSVTKMPKDRLDLELILVSAAQHLRCGPIVVDFCMQQLRKREAAGG